MPTRTELIWDGKYDANGKRVAPLRVALPFQTVETVNESAQERERSLFQFAAQEQPWRNRLVWGDKKYVLPSLLSEFAGKINLIYIDPPFDTGADFSFNAAVPGPEDDEEDGLAFTKQPSIIEQKAYRDTWGHGIDSYLQWFYETVVLLHELLAENGSLYVHLDWRVIHYVKALLDEVFGLDGFLSQIVWRRTNARGTKELWPRLHDTLLLYTKGDTPTFHSVSTKADPRKMPYTLITGKDGLRYQTYELTGPGITKEGDSGKPWRGFDPRKMGRHWANAHVQMDKWDAVGFIHWPANGGFPRRRAEEPFKEEERTVVVGDVWDDIDRINQAAKERLNYPTQKPVALLERIIKASSNENDLVLDCFCGSGTTAAVAEKLNRRWIACDLGRFAIHTTRKRLLSIDGVRPFIVQNLGKYERQLWQTGQFAREGPETPEQAALRHRAYTEFILKLYGATPLRGYTWLHGTRNGRLIHVGSVEAPVTTGDITNIAVEFKKAIGTGKDAPKTNGVDVLGWDFAFELHEVSAQQAAAANIRLQFKRIPRDVMDKRAVDQGDIKFFELAALGVETKAKGREITLTLTDFVIPPDDVPEDVRTAVKHWSQWIDYWAVDWDNKGDTFHNEWQAFRTRKDSRLLLTATHRHAEPGEYRVVVKVIDILGNDTTKTVKVKVK
jgi:adenine-specific DNA-methyltransferase